MALEDLTGTKYIDDLNSSNPAAGDNVSEGDDHIRGIKNVLKTTFPSIDGAITATDTELNYVDGVTSAIQTQLDAKLPLAGGAMTGAITTNSTFDGVDVAACNTTANAALPKAGGAMTGAITTNSTFDGVDVAACNTTANAALPKAGGTMTGNIVSGDNVKATYGTGADLEIYHDGSDSKIVDKGTGNMLLLTNGNFYVQNEAGSKTIIRGDVDGAVKNYYDNNLRLETTNAGVSVTGSITPTGSITHASDLNLDAASDIVLDADGGKIRFRDAGTEIGRIVIDNSQDLEIVSSVADKDLKFKGNDGGSTITALTLDMSAAGAATFGSYVDLQTNNLYLSDSAKANFGSSEDLQIYHDGQHSYVHDTGSGNLFLRGEQIILKSQTDNDDYMKCNENGNVELYYSNAKKLETETGGVSVTGSVWASAGRFGLDSNDHIDIETTTIQFKLNGNEEMRLEADGDLHVDGDVIAYSTTVSDERLKENIEVVEGALDKVKELKGVTFTRKQDGVESAGVIAQDVEKVLPQAVKHKALPLQTGNDELFKTVQYDALHALLIESIKELTAKVEKLESK